MSNLIPGGRKPAADCEQEFLTQPVPPLGLNGIPVKTLQCVDDDPTCDFGAASGDRACTFRVAMCLNVTDTRFACTPTDVATAKVRTLIKGTIDEANREALQLALTDSIGGVAQPICINAGPLRGEPCVVNSDCDSAPGRSNGRCQIVVVFTPPLTTRDLCTSFADIVVPLTQTQSGLRNGVKVIGIQAYPSNDPVTGKRRMVDSSFLKLTCQP